MANCSVPAPLRATSPHPEPYLNIRAKRGPFGPGSRKAPRLGQAGVAPPAPCPMCQVAHYGVTADRGVGHPRGF